MLKCSCEKMNQRNIIAFHFIKRIQMHRPNHSQMHFFFFDVWRWACVFGHFYVSIDCGCCCYWMWSLNICKKIYEFVHVFYTAFFYIFDCDRLRVISLTDFFFLLFFFSCSYIRSLCNTRFLCATNAFWLFSSFCFLRIKLIVLLFIRLWKHKKKKFGRNIDDKSIRISCHECKYDERLEWEFHAFDSFSVSNVNWMWQANIFDQKRRKESEIMRHLRSNIRLFENVHSNSLFLLFFVLFLFVTFVNRKYDLNVFETTDDRTLTLH